MQAMLPRVCPLVKTHFPRLVQRNLSLSLLSLCAIFFRGLAIYTNDSPRDKQPGIKQRTSDFRSHHRLKIDPAKIAAKKKRRRLERQKSIGCLSNAETDSPIGRLLSCISGPLCRRAAVSKTIWLPHVDRR